VTAVVAELAVRRGREAIDFYVAAFGAREVYRVGGDERNEAVVGAARARRGDVLHSTTSRPRTAP
jgi:uncharacterized glyoxalase superfamily protein PhnB